MQPEEKRELTKRLMRSQLNLSYKVAAAFGVVLLGLPLVNLYLPELAKTKVLGLSLSWLILGVLFYPFTLLLSAWFVRSSERIEAETVQRES